jgi:tRNA(Ile)-lysidine synthase
LTAVAWPPGTAALLARCRFPPPPAPVVCAVSGGPDSLALLALAVAAGLDVQAVHVDHGIRPAGRDEAAVVEQASARLGAGFERLAVTVPPGPDLEARARAARYEALPHGVLTGHTADDQAETLLLNLLRGSGLDGLGGMRPDGSGPRAARRPLLALRRWETEAFALALGLQPVHDPSNADLRFRRNRVRHELMPTLAAVAGRDPVPLLARTARLLAADAVYLTTVAATLDPTDVVALRHAPRPVASRALRGWLRQERADGLHPPSAAELERVWDVVEGRAKACELAGGRRVSRSAGRLRLALANRS